jgi:transposase
MCLVAAGLVAVIRIDAIWLATAPLEMRAGAETALAHVVRVFGAARPHHAYLLDET